MQQYNKFRSSPAFHPRPVTVLIIRHPRLLLIDLAPIRIQGTGRHLDWYSLSIYIGRIAKVIAAKVGPIWNLKCLRGASSFLGARIHKHWLTNDVPETSKNNKITRQTVHELSFARKVSIPRFTKKEIQGFFSYFPGYFEVFRGQIPGLRVYSLLIFGRFWKVPQIIQKVLWYVRNH